jgi:hypothetical protein
VAGGRIAGAFRQTRAQEDDVTLVVIRIDQEARAATSGSE